MKANDIMTRDPVVINQGKLVKNAATLMSERNLSTLPIVDERNELVGIITESDFIGKSVDIPRALVSLKQLFNENFSNGDVEKICAKAKEKTLKEVMSTHLITISPEASLNDIVHTMVERNVKRLPVMDGSKLVGILTRKDVVRAYAE